MPSVRVHLCPMLVSGDELPGSIAVVIDVLRATTTIAHALAAGCEAVYPCAEIPQAKALARSLAPASVLLAGERNGVTIPGFEAGNSPTEYTVTRCKGVRLVMTTTNGTRAMLLAAIADIVLLGCFNNLATVVHALVNQARPIDVICAGDEGQIALEDVLVAGAIVAQLGGRTGNDLNDGARLALGAYERYRDDLQGAMTGSASGQRLTALGCTKDIRIAAALDTLQVLPTLKTGPDGRLQITEA